MQVPQRFNLAIPQKDETRFWSDWRLLSLKDWPTVKIRIWIENGVVRIQIETENEEAVQVIRNEIFGPRGYMTSQGWSLMDDTPAVA